MLACGSPRSDWLIFWTVLWRGVGLYFLFLDLELRSGPHTLSVHYTTSTSGM